MLSSPLSLTAGGEEVEGAAGGGGGGGGQSHSLNFSVGSLGKGGSMHWLLVKTNLEEKYFIFHYSRLALASCSDHLTTL